MLTSSLVILPFRNTIYIRGDDVTTLTARIVRSEFNNSDIFPGKHYSDDYSCLSNTYQIEYLN